MEFIHDNGVSIVTTEDGRNLSSTIKPEFSFEYESLAHTTSKSEYTSRGIKHQLSIVQKDEIVLFLESVQEDKEKTAILIKNKENELFLKNTDWMVLRHIREKSLGVTLSISESEYLELEEKRNLLSKEIIKL